MALRREIRCFSVFYNLSYYYYYNFVQLRYAQRLSDSFISVFIHRSNSSVVFCRPPLRSAVFRKPPPQTIIDLVWIAKWNCVTVKYQSFAVKRKLCGFAKNKYSERVKVAKFSEKIFNELSWCFLFQAIKQNLDFISWPQTARHIISSARPSIGSYLTSAICCCSTNRSNLRQFASRPKSAPFGIRHKNKLFLLSDLYFGQETSN